MGDGCVQNKNSTAPKKTIRGCVGVGVLLQVLNGKKKIYKGQCEFYIHEF